MWAMNPDNGEVVWRTALGHGEFTLTKHNREPRRRFGVTVKSAKPCDWAALAAC